jgi:hypothetical protein
MAELVAVAFEDPQEADRVLAELGVCNRSI